MRNRLLWGATAVLMIFGIVFGLWLAKVKTLWNDEIYTQIYTVEPSSYIDILTLCFEEGNSCPLFYLFQKAVVDISRYPFPKEWTRQWDTASRMLLRLPANIFMTLSVVLIFYFFARYYSWVLGGYALLVSLSSYMIIIFWAEARPYALWVFLTTAQSLLFLKMMREEGEKVSTIRSLIAVHLLLSFSVVFSMIQIAVVSFLLWIWKVRDLKQYVWLTALPVGICLFYFFHSPKFQFWFLEPPSLLIFASIPKDRMLILGGYVVLLLGSFAQRKVKRLKLYAQDASWDGARYLALTSLMLLAACVLMAVFKLREVSPEQGFQISNRYLIYLAPVGSIAVTLFSRDMVKAFKGKIWLQGVVVLGLAALLILRISRTYTLACHFYSSAF